jgi:crossover junction endonuclease MUS81
MPVSVQPIIIVQIDVREKKLITLFENLIDEFGYMGHITLEKKNLPLGDVLIKCQVSGHDINSIPQIIIERKSLPDLASSIRDGRYKEQSFRLNQSEVHNHNILYLIEGDMSMWSESRMRVKKKTLYSAMFTLNYYKGFSVVRSQSVLETAEIIINMCDKLYRENTKSPYYANNAQILNPELQEEEYCSVLKKAKSAQVTTGNIGEIMLCQIPRVSGTSAIAIMDKYKTIETLMNEIKIDSECLESIQYMTKTGKSRHISKSCIENVKKYLVQNNETQI